MEKIINFIKMDFWMVKDTLECLVKRQIPLWVFTIYYVTLGVIMIPILPLIWIYVKIRVHFMMKAIEKRLEEI